MTITSRIQTLREFSKSEFQGADLVDITPAIEMLEENKAAEAATLAYSIKYCSLDFTRQIELLGRVQAYAAALARLK